ncbi:MAG: hypothetical protein K8S16_13990 [Bacteroidales bacterium]|nr:hypothetical protein [Bacteroidales bacterium]
MASKIILSIVIYVFPLISALSQETDNKVNSYLPSKDLLLGQWEDETDSLTTLVIDENLFYWYSSSDTVISVSPYSIGDSCRIQNNKLRMYRYIRFIDEEACFEILGLSEEHLSFIDLQFGYISIYKRKKSNIR